MVEKNPPWWENDMPADLMPAVEHLRRKFLASHFKNGEITRQICFDVLHSQGIATSGNWRSGALGEIEALVSAAAVVKFDSLLSGATLSSTAAAFFVLYVEAMNSQAFDIFHELLAIAFKNQELISAVPLEWAKAQIKELVESKRYLIRRWVKDVCDVQWVPGQPLPKAGEYAEWASWEAPRFLIMEPLCVNGGPITQQEPFDLDTAWERLDCSGTKFVLLDFEHRYTETIRITLRRVAGEVAVYMAKHGTPPPFVQSPKATAEIPRAAKIPAPKGTAKKKPSEKRHETIHSIIQSGVVGIAYCKTMDERGIKPPHEWISQSWPGSYAAAYGSGKTEDREKWKAAIQKEKTRHKNK